MNEPNYLTRVTQFLTERKLTAGVHHVRVLHDDWCAIFKGGACNCHPDVEACDENGRRIGGRE